MVNDGASSVDCDATIAGAERTVSLPFIWEAASSNARCIGDEEIAISSRGGVLATCTMGLGALMTRLPLLVFSATDDEFAEPDAEGSEELDFLVKSRWREGRFCRFGPHWPLPRASGLDSERRWGNERRV